MTPVLTALTLLADKPTQTGPEFGKASPVGLLVVVLLLIATFVLVWSMNRHLKRLPKTFDPEPESAENGVAAEPRQAADADRDVEPSPDRPGS